jgi:hypothetical protein
MLEKNGMVSEAEVDACDEHQIQANRRGTTFQPEMQPLQQVAAQGSPTAEAAKQNLALAGPNSQSNGQEIEMNNIQSPPLASTGDLEQRSTSITSAEPILYMPDRNSLI